MTMHEILRKAPDLRQQNILETLATMGLTLPCNAEQARQVIRSARARKTGSVLHQLRALQDRVAVCESRLKEIKEIIDKQ